MASAAFGSRTAQVYTRDGRDGFPSEADFEMILAEYMEGLNPKKREKALMSQTMYDDILTILAEPGNTQESTAQFRFWAKKMFRLVVTAHAQVVTHENRPVAVREQIYDVLVQCHNQCSHGGRDKTSNQVRRFYSWIPKELIARFVKACPFCQHRRMARVSSTGQFSYLDESSSPSDSGSGSIGGVDSKPPSTRTTPQRPSKATAASAAALAHKLAMAAMPSLPSTQHTSSSIAPEFSIPCPPMPVPSSNPFDWSGSWSKFGQPNLHFNYAAAQEKVQLQPAQQVNSNYPHMQAMPPHLLSPPISITSNHSDAASTSEQDVFGAAAMQVAAPGPAANETVLFTPRTAQLVDGWYASPEGQQAALMMSRTNSGMSDMSQQSSIDQMSMSSQGMSGGLLPPGLHRSPVRCLSFESNLTIDTSESERPGSACSDASFFPITPTTPSDPRASRSPAPLTADPQEVQDSVEEYFNQYGDGMDLISQAASLEGLAGVALMKNVVKATSVDLAKAASKGSRRSSPSKPAARAAADNLQSQSSVIITIENHQSQSQAVADAVEMYNQHHNYLAYGDQTFETTSSGDFSFEHYGMHDFNDTAGQYNTTCLAPQHLHDHYQQQIPQHEQSPVSATGA